MRVALATDMLVCAEGLHGAPPRAAALALLRRIPQLTVFIPVEALSELFDVLVRRGGRDPARARNAVLGWRDAFASIETTPSALVSAMDLTVGHGFSISDAVIVAAAAEAECRLLLSESLDNGFTRGGVTVANPFSETRHPLLDAMLADADRWNAEK